MIQNTHPQTPRNSSRKPVRKIAAVCVGLLLLLAGGWYALVLDWKSLGDAVPPKPPAAFSPEIAKLVEFGFEGYDDPAVLPEQITLTTANWVTFRGFLETDVEKWIWSPLSYVTGEGTHEAIDAYLEAHRHLPTLRLRALLIADSSKPPGHVVYWESLSQIRRASKDRARFSFRMWMPERPGQYELRLVVNRVPYDPAFFGPNDPNEYVVGSIPIEVVRPELND